VRVRALIAVSTAALVLLAAGCGGGGTPSAEETWAASVCTSIATWKTDVEAITKNATDAITEPGATRKDVETAIDGGVVATEALVDDLRALTPPDTPEGQQAKAEANAFLADAQDSIDEVKQTIDELPDSASLVAVIAKLSGLASNLQTTLQSGRDLVDSLPELGGDLKAGFENADSCQDLRN
jgi:flagellar hook-length control protein FliK